MKNDHKKISKLMSLILRHNPGVIGAYLDQNGWLSVDELIVGINRKGFAVNHELLEEIVSTNNKQRFTFNEDKTHIRANQGHSIEVDVELKETKPPELLYHGTVDKFMDDILEDGLKKMNRQHVHLSKDIDTAQIVGNRRGKATILIIHSGEMYKKGHSFYLSKNGVWLTDHVPANFIQL